MRLPQERVAVLVRKGDSGNWDSSFEKVFSYLKNRNLCWKFPVRELYHPTKKGYDIEIQVPVVGVA